MSFPLTTVQTALYSRLTADTSSVGLVGLLGAAARILHADEGGIPTAPMLTYRQSLAQPGQSSADRAPINEMYFEFQIFAVNYNAIAERLYRLLHNHRLGSQNDAGAALGVWVWTSPDQYDEDLKVGRKDLRFRYFVVPKSQAPI